MHFSVIYSFDTDGPVGDYTPRNRKLWDLTECYTEDGYKHRKYAAVLTKDEWLAFCDEMDLTYDCETMGMIGAPGFGFMHLPALNYTDPCHDVSCYVCPVPSQCFEPMDRLKPSLQDDEFRGRFMGRYVDRAMRVMQAA